MERPNDTKEEVTNQQCLAQNAQISPDGPRVVSKCYCHNGQSLLDNTHKFEGFDGLTVQLKSETQSGTLALSPIIGDLNRTFINFEGTQGELVEIGCPTCAEPLPDYDACSCGAHLVSMFTSPDQNFANCIGICPRIGCLHSKIITNFNLRKLSRNGYF